MRIIKIKKVGKRQTYDFKVANTNSFVANGVVAHNSGSIEENADVLLALHYPFSWSIKEDRRKLEVIILKNRYGATGMVELRLDPECYIIREGEADAVPGM